MLLPDNMMIRRVPRPRKATRAIEAATTRRDKCLGIVKEAGWEEKEEPLPEEVGLEEEPLSEEVGLLVLEEESEGDEEVEPLLLSESLGAGRTSLKAELLDELESVELTIVFGVAARLMPGASEGLRLEVEEVYEVEGVE